MSSMQGENDDLQECIVREKQAMPWKQATCKSSVPRPVTNTLITKWKADFWKAQEDNRGMVYLQF